MIILLIIAILASFSTLSVKAEVPMFDEAKDLFGVAPQDTAKVKKPAKIKMMGKDSEVVVNKPKTEQQESGKSTKLEPGKSTKQENSTPKPPQTKKAAPRAESAKRDTTNVNGEVMQPNNIATYPGGTKAMREYVKNNTRYPAECRSERLIGRTIVAVKIMPDGSHTSASIHKSSGNSHMDTEALRVVNQMPTWTPANDKKNGKEHTAYITVSFRPGR